MGMQVDNRGQGNKENLFRGTMGDALMFALDHHELMLPDSRVAIGVGGLKELLMRKFNLTPKQFVEMSGVRQNQITIRMARMIEKQFERQYPEEWRKLNDAHRRAAQDSKMQDERARIHRDVLQPWAAGPLRLEKPQGSSFHHLLSYDAFHGGSYEKSMRDDDMQCVVVENDWGRLAPPAENGDEWRTPFRLCCWEFRISGVRVMAFTESELTDHPIMWMVYGVQRHWVLHDYMYDMKVRGREAIDLTRNDNVDFPRVVNMVYGEIRAACIMLDARVCHGETVQAPEALVQRARQEGRVAPKSYQVVRLMRNQTRRVARSRGADTSGMRTPQRGHWRRATWVHYDDQDSGEVQYVNDGGFVVSKTWRRWHFAGDPNNIIEREYRL